VFGDAEYDTDDARESAEEILEAALSTGINPRRSDALKALKEDIKEVFEKYGDEIETPYDALERLNQTLLSDFGIEVGNVEESYIYRAIKERMNRHLWASVKRVIGRLKEFTDILSHDLRNPLNVLSGNLNQYKRTGDEKHIEVIERTTDRMERLVDDLLRVARQGQVVEQPEPTDIGTVLETARKGALPETATLRYEAVPRVMADPDRLVQVFENLLRNSAEHGGDDVTVRIGSLQRGFYVEDDGPGIPEDDRDRVFDHGYTTRENGTGYGLSVVRSVVGAHGWDVSVVDTDRGGARFEVTAIEFVDGE
jgi:signal transduction histidine kinase